MLNNKHLRDKIMFLSQKLMKVIVTNMFTRISRLILIPPLFLTMISCGSVPTKLQIQQPVTNTTPANIIQLEQIPGIITAAKSQIEPTRSKDLLKASNALLNYNEFEWMITVLEDVDPKFLDYDEKADRILLYSQASIARGDQTKAIDYLFSDELESLLPRISTSTKLDTYDQKATFYHNTGEYKKAINERTKRTNLITDEFEQQLNQDLIWQSLMELPRSTLQSESTRQQSQVAQGWYSLAAISKNNQSNIAQQLRDINNWSVVWQDHPAAKLLPADLLVIKQIAAEQVDSLGILLPLTGRLSKAGSAIRDGMMAAYYSASTQGEYVPVLKFYDTHQRNIDEVYQQAIYDGAQAIVGPLSKTNIDSLIKNHSTSITTLALNRSQIPVDVLLTSNQTYEDQRLPSEIPLAQDPQDYEKDIRQTAGAVNDSRNESPESLSQISAANNNNNNIFQFALSIEDEAQQIAERAWRDGHRRVMMMYPGRSSGQRNATQFKQAWLNLGGEVLTEVVFDKQQQYSELVESAMQINASKQRHKTVQQLVGQTVKFEPRARQDVDFIYLVSRAQEARQLKPIFAFHYAGDVPVYATSDIFTGEQQARSNQDINGIRFTTIPWFFENELNEKKSIASYIGETGQYQRLYAFGIDAYRLYPRLKKLRQIRQSNFYGVTGKLSLDNQQRIIREQIWAQFNQGVATPLANTAEETTSEF